MTAQEPDRNFFLLLSGQMVSVFGSSVYLVVVILYLKELTGGAAALGIFQFVAYLPIVLLSPVGGVAADSMSRKSILVSTDLIRGLMMMVLGVLVFAGKLNYPILLIGTFCISLCTAFFHPAVHSFFPEIVPPSTLRRKNSVKSAGLLGSNITGSTLGGILYSSLGPGAVFLFNGLTFIASAVEESFIKSPCLSPPNRDAAGSVYRRFNDLIREVGAYLREERGISTVLLTYGLVNSLYPPVILSLPFLLEERYGLGPGYFGLALSLLLAGGGCGALLYGFIDRGRKANGRLFFSSLCLLAFLLISAGILDSPIVLFLVLPPAGGSIGLVHQIMTTSLYQIVRPRARGRIFGIMESLASFAVPLSYAAGGMIIQLMQSRLELFYLGIGAVILAGTGILSFGTRIGSFLTRPESLSSS